MGHWIQILYSAYDLFTEILLCLLKGNEVKTLADRSLAERVVASLPLVYRFSQLGRAICYTKLYSFRFSCKIVSLTAAKTNRIFSVSEGKNQRKWISLCKSMFYETWQSQASHLNLEDFWIVLLTWLNTITTLKLYERNAQVCGPTDMKNVIMEKNIAILMWRLLKYTLSWWSY